MKVFITTTLTNRELPTLAGRINAEANKQLRIEAAVCVSDSMVNIVKYDAIDTGAMLNSQSFEVVAPDVCRVLSPMEYSGYVNWGTIFMAARPLFSEMVAESRKRFPRRIKTALGGRMF